MVEHQRIWCRSPNLDNVFFHHLNWNRSWVIPYNIFQEMPWLEWPFGMILNILPRGKMWFWHLMMPKFSTKETSIQMKFLSFDHFWRVDSFFESLVWCSWKNPVRPKQTSLSMSIWSIMNEPKSILKEHVTLIVFPITVI